MGIPFLEVMRMDQGAQQWMETEVYGSQYDHGFDGGDPDDGWGFTGREDD
jgi:hypothetical protein